MIKSYTNADMLGGLKRLDHVFFSLPAEGGKAALALKEQNKGGYNFLHYVYDELSVPIPDAGPMKFTAENIGKMWTFLDEDSDVAFHGVYNHALTVGWHPAAFQIVQRRLDEWWEEHEDEIVRPCRSLVFGDGERLSRIADDNGGFHWDRHEGLAVLANTELEFACFWYFDD